MPVTINGTTGISGIDGSAATPAVVGTDADTGFFFSAGVISTSANGVAGSVGLYRGTAQNSTSGTAIDFTSIPSWVKRVTVMLNGVSTSGTSNLRFRLGTSGGFVTSGYLGSSTTYGSAVGTANFTAGFDLYETGSALATTNRHGIFIFANITGNTWAANGSFGCETAIGTTLNGGIIALASALTQLRITTVNGTDTFDAGSINILYE